VTEAKSPRLVRDLYFTRARLLENLAMRDHDLYIAAENDYQAGLAVKAVAYEGEARGRALGDLANTTLRAHSRDLAKHDARIVGLFEEALRYLPSDESAVSRATVLTSFAGYLMERPGGDTSLDIEKALGIITEAIDVLEAEIPSKERSPFVKDLLAGAYLNRGNAIRIRARGGVDENLDAARESYRAALEIAKGKNDQLRGTILMNMANASIDRYQVSGDESCLRDASYFFSEAADALEEFPREHGYALFRRASFATLTEDDSGGLILALKDAEAAIELLQSVNASEMVAAAKSTLGILLMLRSKRIDIDDLEKAGREFTEAYELLAECGDIEGAILNARHLADACISLYGLRDGASDLEKARDFLSKACEHVEQLWNRNDSMEWRAEVSLRYGRTYYERAWCEAKCGADPWQVLEIASFGNARELISHVSALQEPRAHMSPGVAAYLDRMRIGRQRAEMSRWSAYRTSGPGVDLTDTIRLTEEERSRLRSRMSLFRQQDQRAEAIRSRIQGFVGNNGAAILCDLIVSRWGSLAVLADATGAKLVQLPGVNVEAIWGWAHGAEGEPDWVGLVQAPGPERLTRRVELAESMDRVLSEVGARIARPIADAIPDARDRTLFLSPGFLVSIPIHAAPLESDGKRMFEHFRGFACVASPAILRPAVYDWTLRGPALCVLSDPAKSSNEELKRAPRELSEVADLLVTNRIAVSVIAAIGSSSGRAVFDRRGIRLPEGATILEQPPTREWLREQISEFAHVFYTGHGVGAEGVDTGLILSGGDGSSRLSNEDVLGMREMKLRPLVLLSACETAREAGGSMELFSFASTLIRSGAGFVIGTMWSVTDECSYKFTLAFYRSLVSPTPAPEAFCDSLRQLIFERAAMGVDFASVPLDHPIYWAGFVSIVGA
jgi:CHAT domain